MKKRKMMVIGAQGFLGSRVCCYYKDRFEVVALGHADMDIADTDAVNACLAQEQPDVVVNCAAISNTGYAQNHPDESYQINYQGSVNVARACAACGARLIYMSSDQVYCGNLEQGLLGEEMEVHPTNVYGQHKLAAERDIADVLPSAVGLRLTWMFDHPQSKMKLNSNVLVNIMNAHRESSQIRIPLRDHRGFTWVWHVVERIEQCLDLPGGIYNFGCENLLNSYESFVAIAQWMGFSVGGDWIIPDSEAFAEHPRNLSISLKKLKKCGIEFPSLEESVCAAMMHVDGLGIG